jgi:hypothetical protein
MDSQENRYTINGMIILTTGKVDSCFSIPDLLTKYFHI